MVIMNQRSGSGVLREERRNGGAARRLTEASIAQDLERCGIGGELWIVSGGELTFAARRAAATRDLDLVIAAGGDGTVGRVAAALQGTEVPLAVLPLGTLNHFARDLGMAPQIEAAISAIAEGEVRRVDVGEVNGRIFVNNSSIGLYPRVVRRREVQRERLGRGKWSSLVSASLLILRRFPLTRVRIAVNGATVERTTPFVFVGNNRYRMDLLSPGGRDALDRGELCLYLPGRTGRFGMLWIAFRALFGRLDQARDFVSICASELWIGSRRQRLHVALDGEVVSLSPPLRYRVRPRALHVIVPRSPAGERRGAA
jgi:diacylglycerol kinase family enzyme